MSEDNPRRKPVTETYKVDTATLILSEPTPCDNGSKCPYWSVCATGYACKDFLTFQHTGQIVREDRVPKAKLFRRIFAINA